MTNFKVTAPHQVERDGRFFSPNQVIPGFDPEEHDDDLTLLELGLVSEVKDDDQPEPAEAITPPDPDPKVSDKKPASGGGKKATGAKAGDDNSKE